MKIILPELGEGISDVEIREVLVEEGDSLTKNDPILILETDKASMEIPSEVDGVISKIHVCAGDKISPNDLILSIKIHDDNITEDNEAPIPSKGTQPNKIESEEQDIITENNTLEKSNKTIQEVDFSKVLASPSTRKLARDLGCDINLINGSGDNSRITREDVLKYVNQHLSSGDTTLNPSDLKKILRDEMSTIKKEIVDEISTTNESKDTDVDYSKWGLTENRPLNKIKIATGNNMSEAWSDIPQVTQFENADITNLYKIYKNLKRSNKNKGIKVSLIPFYINFLVQTIKKFPEINSSLSRDKKSLIIKKYVNVGVAVDTLQGLVVPIIKNCETKSIKEINTELTVLSKKARNSELKINDIEGGTVTISSLGGIGGTYFTPIVVPQQAIILGFSKAESKLILNNKNKKMKNRLILPFSMSYDHRIIDGALAAKFTAELARLLSSVKLNG